MAVNSVDSWQHVASRRLETPAWQRWLMLLLSIGVGTVAIGIAVTYVVPVYRNYQVTLIEEAKIRHQLEAMRQLQANEEAKLRWLRNDDAYLEIQARDKLDLQAPGETIVRFRNTP